MNQSIPTIVLTGGGSGGHITPLLSLAHELKAKSPDCRIVYVGHKGDNFDKFKNRTGDFDFMVFIEAGKFRRYHGRRFFSRIVDIRTFILNARDLLRLPGSIWQASQIISKFKPDVVFSKGSFVAVPVGIAARLRSVPIVTHDSDTIPGLANKIIGRWAQIHATGMPAKYYQYPKSSVRYTGIPLDPRVKKVTSQLQKAAKQLLKLPEDAQVLLVSGGGNGSQHINELMVAVAPRLLETNLALHIFHIAGTLHQQAVDQAYKSRLPRAQQKRVRTIGFTSDFYSLLTAADLALGRAGATTIAELAVAGKACILIPAPFLTNGHQLKNAEALAAADAAVILDDNVQADELLAIINELLGDDRRRYILAKNLAGMAKLEAAAELAGLILSVVEN